MNHNGFQIGDLVTLTSGEWKDHAGVVSCSITQENAGYVLFYIEGGIAGTKATIDEIQKADEGSEGFSQLTYHLLKLSSHVIEKIILPAVKTNK